MKILKLILLMIIASLGANAQDYTKLDAIISDFNKIITNKQNRIAVLSEGEKNYGFNDRLYAEYMSFKYDSAYKYITDNLKLVENSSDREKLYDCLLKYVHILAVAGHFQEATAELMKINPDSASNNQKTAYYAKKADLFLYNSEFTENSAMYSQMRDSTMYYHKKIIEYADQNSFEYAFSDAVIAAENQDFKNAEKILLKYFDNNKPDSRTYSIIISTLAFYCQMDGDMVDAEKYYLLSAENDLENAIIENSSLRHLAEILFDKGDYSRAFNYLMACSDCANFYGSRLRNVQIASILNKIITSYADQKKDVYKRTLIFLVLISIIAAALVFLTIKIIKKNKSYAIANYRITVMNKELDTAMLQLKDANASLHESNKIKDEYIGRFMEVCSRIIENYSQKHATINKLAREKKMAELYAEIKKEDLINDSTKLFYDNFDEAFLNLFPDFNENVNRLLKPDSQINVKEGSLTTELRILALLRLGFTDNKQIASILRSSITTIYTYRSKIRSKAVDKDTFEETVAAL